MALMNRWTLFGGWAPTGRPGNFIKSQTSQLFFASLSVSQPQLPSRCYPLQQPLLLPHSNSPNHSAQIFTVRVSLKAVDPFLFLLNYLSPSHSVNAIHYSSLSSCHTAIAQATPHKSTRPTSLLLLHSIPQMLSWYPLEHGGGKNTPPPSPRRRSPPAPTRQGLNPC